MTKRATIHDIAALTGVSPSTISRVLNHPDLVNSTTKSLVYDAMEKLDYVPQGIKHGEIEKINHRSSRTRYKPANARRNNTGNQYRARINRIRSLINKYEKRKISLQILYGKY